MKKWVLIVALAVVVVTVVLILTHKRPESVDTPIVITPQAPIVLVPPRNITLRLTVTEQYFSPANITLYPTDRLTVQVISADGTHHLTVPLTGEQVTVAQGETRTVSLPQFARTASLVCGDCIGKPFMIYVKP